MVKIKPQTGTINNLPAADEDIIASVSFVNPRIFTITGRVTYHASATQGIRVRLYFSPDGDNWDTVDYTYFDVALSAGNTVQESHVIDVPAEGYMRISVLNRDANYPAGNIKAWASIQEWGGKEQ